MGPLSRFLFPDGLAEGARSSEQVSSRRAETCRGQFSFWAVFFSPSRPYVFFFVRKRRKVRRAGWLRRASCALELRAQETSLE